MSTQLISKKSEPDKNIGKDSLIIARTGMFSPIGACSLLAVLNHKKTLKTDKLITLMVNAETPIFSSDLLVIISTIAANPKIEKFLKKENNFIFLIALNASAFMCKTEKGIMAKIR